MSDLHSQKILILDFGSQYTQLIARRVREIGVFSEIRAWDITEEEIREFNPRGIILSGSPESVTGGASAPRAPDCVFTMGLPVLGICYGMQTLNVARGGSLFGSLSKPSMRATSSTRSALPSTSRSPSRRRQTAPSCGLPHAPTSS